MTNPNSIIREAVKHNGIFLWEVAAAADIGEATLMRWLREDLTGERKRIVLNAIEELKKKKQLEKEAFEASFPQEQGNTMEDKI